MRSLRRLLSSPAEASAEDKLPRSVARFTRVSYPTSHTTAVSSIPRLSAELIQGIIPFEVFELEYPTSSSAPSGPLRWTPPGVEDDCTVSVELLDSRNFREIVFAPCSLNATARTTSPRPTAWIRSGVESDREIADAYLFLLFETACIVCDRPDFPRVTGVVVNRSGECAQSWKLGTFAAVCFLCVRASLPRAGSTGQRGRASCVCVRAAPDREARTSGVSDT